MEKGKNGGSSTQVRSKEIHKYDTKSVNKCLSPPTPTTAIHTTPIYPTTTPDQKLPNCAKRSASPVRQSVRSVFCDQISWWNTAYSFSAWRWEGERGTARFLPSLPAQPEPAFSWLTCYCCRSFSSAPSSALLLWFPSCPTPMMLKFLSI